MHVLVACAQKQLVAVVFGPYLTYEFSIISSTTSHAQIICPVRCKATKHISTLQYVSKDITWCERWRVGAHVMEAAKFILKL